MKTYFLLLPKPGGRDRWEYIPVDVQRLRRNAFSEFYEYSLGTKHNTASYKPVLIDVPGADVLDVGELVAHVGEIFRECATDLEEFGETGGHVKAVLPDENQLVSLLTALSEGRVAKADEHLRRMLYRMKQNAAALATELTTTESVKNGMEVALDHAKNTSAQIGGIKERLFFEWALVASELVYEVKDLMAYEERLEAFVRRIETAVTGWERALGDDAPLITTTMEYLDGDVNSFVVKALSYLRNAGSVEDIDVRVQEALRYIGECRKRENDAAALWQNLSTEVVKEILPLRTDIDRRCDDLAEHTQKMRGYQQQFPPGTERPYEAGIGHISEAEFKEAEQILLDPRWAPRDCKRRIHGRIQGILALTGNRPALPDTVASVFRQAESYIAQIRSEREPANKRAGGSTERQCHDPASGGMTMETAPGDETRVRELYELIVCVACALTCKHHRFATTNVRSLLRVVRRLRLCTPEEADGLFKKAVSEMVQRDVEYVRESGKVHERWENSERTWIRFDVKGHKGAGLKLSSQARARAEQLMEKHGLTTDGIKSTHRTLCEELRKAYKESKATSPS